MERSFRRERATDSKAASTITEETGGSTQENEPVSKSRNIRSCYRALENRINEGKDDLASGDSENFMTIMKEVENIHQHVKKPREQVADAETLLGLTRNLAACVRTHTSGGVTPAEFISGLIRKFEQQNSTKWASENSQCISWQTIGRLVSPVFMNGSGCKTMNGPMRNTLKPRKLTVRARRSRPVGKAHPKELEKDAEVVTDTDKNLRVMFEILKKNKKVNVENLILNRTSFAQTVENLFALSFLVKDGRVRVDVDESGSQLIVPTNGPSAEDIKNRVVENHQFIFRFDFNDWKLMKTTVKEGNELMPQRDTFDNATNAKAKTEPCKQEPPIPEGVPFYSCSVRTAPVKKFSKNNGLTMGGSFLFGIDEGIIGNWNCKRKRTVL
ncbi:Non-structural maintenance of chromosomes element 4 homolog A [Striga hermonthica]|uniref:Non-structural maintenance of chromosomes element 4 n=1 Tax=Striga hermonthica TaxID=68872 RepID=A0A9N7MXC8_STRHE|nr:Non-structural maintenance of chromosomes element 4 homolog A [Striga hermonthica]